MRNGGVLDQKTLGHVCVPVLQFLVNVIDEREHLGSRDSVLCLVERAGDFNGDAADCAPPVEHTGDMAGKPGVGRARVRLPDIVFMPLMDDTSNGRLLRRVDIKMLHQRHGRRSGVSSVSLINLWNGAKFGNIRSHVENAPKGPVNRPSFFRIFHRMRRMRRSILLGSTGGQIKIDPSHSIFAHQRRSIMSEKGPVSHRDKTYRTNKIMSPWIVGRLGQSPSSSPASNRRRASSKN